MTSADWTMDGALSIALPYLAWRAVVSDNLHKAVVLFIALGLLSSLAWARLVAPDVALVEAAVGAGLTGALLMCALGWVEETPSRRPSWFQRLVLAVLLLGLAAGLGVAITGLPPRDPGLGDEVLAKLPDSGVLHPVTAVLLNFRGYDTLLEVAVLLSAAVGAASWSGQRASNTRGETTDPLLAVLVRLLVPGIILVAGYLLWRGSHAPGGAFQAGAILGGAGILLSLAGTVRPLELSSSWVRAGLLIGFAIFLAVAATPLMAGGHLLQYPPRWAGGLILAIESALTLSIALILTVFFTGVARLDPSGAEAPRRTRP